MIEESDLLRLIAGDCSPAEAATIQAWIVADPRRAELLDELRAVWDATGDTTRPWDVAAARERLLSARRRPAAPLEASKRSWWVALWPAGIAAAVIIVMAGAVLWHPRRSPEPPREYVTAPGQRLALSFPDGSHVVLGVDSRLRVAPGFGVRERAVELEGEAYFVVRHDPEHPFRVRTRHGVTEDLGTEFDVRAYCDEAYLQVVVAAGRVALRSARVGDSTLTLRPRDRGVMDSSGVGTITNHVSLASYLAWTRGALVFNDAPLGAVVAQLERWYDLDIRSEDRSLEKERVTISFRTQSADEALASLTKVLGVRFTRTDRVVRLVPVHPRQ